MDLLHLLDGTRHLIRDILKRVHSGIDQRLVLPALIGNGWGRLFCLRTYRRRNQQDLFGFDLISLQLVRSLECLYGYTPGFGDSVQAIARSDHIALFRASLAGNTEPQDLEVQVLNAQRKSADVRAIARVRSKQGEQWKREEEEKQRVAEEDRERFPFNEPADGSKPAS